MRKDGKFIGVDGSIPEGQGIVMAHLNECHELLEMVRNYFIFHKHGCLLTDARFQLKERMDEGNDDEFDEDEDSYTFDSGSESGGEDQS